MKNEIVFDIETQNTFMDVGGYNHSLLKVSLVGVYFYATEEYKCFLEKDLPSLWGYFEQADRLIGYNNKKFDLPVLNNYYAGDLSRLPTLDILEVIEKSLGFRLKLDDVAVSTLGYGKSGSGLQAVEFFRQGKIEELKAYCLQDVKVTKEIYEYGLMHKALAYTDMLGQRQGIPVDFTAPEELQNASINLTMPL